MADKRTSRLERSSSKPAQKQGASPGKKKKKKRITMKRLLWTSFFTIAFAIFCAIAGYMYITVSGEKILAENKDKLFIYETSKVYDRTGQLMGELSVNRSEPVEEEDIPEVVKQAFKATEDRRFDEHNGVDLWAIGRAAVKDVMARSLKEGGSTITQQLAKNMFLDFDKTFFRKATEMSIAMALERHNTKDEILTMYLNRIFFGQKSYGIKAASQRYFGKSDLNDLELWEVATLAAIPKGPSIYNPVSNPEQSLKRRAVVLELMYQEGYITAAERDQAKAVEYAYVAPDKGGSYQAFMDYVVKEAEDKFGLTEDQMNRGGYKIYTTMDMQAQKAVEKAFANDDFFEESVDEQQVQASIVIQNHENGSLIALLGGRDYERKGFSRVTSRRQPGSAFKPIVSYAPALESGKFTVNSLISNEQQCFGDYCPKNLHGYSKTIDMTTALTKSENIPAVWLLNEVGVGTGLKMAKDMGITMDKDDRNLAIALGGLTYGTNTLEMSGAFSVFANGGNYNEPYSIKSIQDHDGVEKYKYNAPKPKRVISEQTAYYMTSMMQNVINDGTGKRAKIDRPVAGKTGTTQHGISGLKSSKNRDVWFVGYTPEWTASIWMGYDQADKNHLLNGSSGQAASLFATIMKEALAGVPVKDFPVPGNLEPIEPEEEPVLNPANLAATYNQETGVISLTWEGVDTEGAVYRLYRRALTETDFALYYETQATAAEDIAAEAGSGYEYYVTAYDPANSEESEPSNIAQVLIVADDPPMDNIDPEDGVIVDPGSGDNPGSENGNGQGTEPGQGEGTDSGNGAGSGDNGSNGTENGQQPDPGQGGGDSGGNTQEPPENTGGNGSAQEGQGGENPASQIQGETDPGSGG